MNAIRYANDVDSYISEEFVLIWGDAVVSGKDIFIEAMTSNSQIGIPVYRTEDPYVSFKVNERLEAESVDLSKYGETNSFGYQDLCVFFLHREAIMEICDCFHSAAFKGGRYITETGEFEFLYIVHTGFNLGFFPQCYLSDYKDQISSYNTINELNLIKEKNI